MVVRNFQNRDFSELTWKKPDKKKKPTTPIGNMTGSCKLPNECCHITVNIKKNRKISIDPLRNWTFKFLLVCLNSEVLID